MHKIIHHSARASHYDTEAEHYDLFNEYNSRILNLTVENILKKYKVKSVLDVTCGTGSQVFWLNNRGFNVVGSDINSKMLAIAKSKAKTAKRDIKFIKGDMRNIKVGKFDAIISMFNAVGHLTKQDFVKAMKNAAANLDNGGIYIFDNFNLAYMLHDNNITALTIDFQKRTGNKVVRDFQYSTIDEKGILASFTTMMRKTGNRKPTVTETAQTLQIYTTKQLKMMLSKCGFEVLSVCNVDGSKFHETQSERMLMVARKIK